MADAEYKGEMDQGRAALAVRDYRAAYRHFGRAHNLGHDVLADHLAAHRGLLATAWKQRRFDRVVAQLFLMGGAALFDRNQQKPTSVA
ncbi:DUF3703 domain-containing protein [Amycolatopsis sp. NPDC004079]|uniref:DUF3703 domain-containing protein n=1 Tax=Amycolatopsis halotolerans TaxID=330083 RepID=A0ABV7QVL9_9PSEU